MSTRELRRAGVRALIRTKYGGRIGERFGPTLAAEHLASEDRITVDHETLQRWMLAAGLWSRLGSARRKRRAASSTTMAPIRQRGARC